MWKPGTLLHLRYGCATILRPPPKDMKQEAACLVIHAQQLSWGTRGPTCSYLLLVMGRLFTAMVDNVEAERNFVPHEET